MRAAKYLLGIIAVAIAILAVHRIWGSPAPDAAAPHIRLEAVLRDSTAALLRRAAAAESAQERARLHMEEIDSIRKAEHANDVLRIARWRAEALTAHGAVIYRDTATNTPYIPLDTAARMVESEHANGEATVAACRVTLSQCEGRAVAAEDAAAAALRALAEADTARDAERTAERRKHQRGTAVAVGIGFIIGVLATVHP